MENKKIILIVEDEKTLRDALHLKLSKSGFDVIEASNGEEALAFSLDKHPDLILLDLIMPRMDGITMLRLLRNDDWGKNVPVIILTNIILDENKRKDILDLEPTYYFVKVDIKIEELVNKIKEKLGIK